MFCKNCGNKLDVNDKFCSKCGSKNEIISIQQAQNNNINKKEKFLNTSTISFFIFVFIVLLNIIVYPLSMTDNEQTSGLAWFALAFLPSIPLGLTCFILGVISIAEFIKDKKNNIYISKFRFVFIILNILQFVLLFIGVIWWFSLIHM